ncbi:Putative cyclin-D7-1 [Linum perenne]
MEALLFCDEVWLCDPATPTATDDPTCANVETCSLSASSYNSLTKEECEEALATWMEEEANYVPENGYVDCLHRSTSFLFARSRAIQWVLKACGQLNLSVSTVFSASNYLDRFMSMHRRLKWETWMVELVTVACLSVAAKFNETASTAPSLDDFQMEEMEHCFKPSSIQQVELLVLQALKWRVSSTTCYSYAELLLMNIANYSSMKPEFHHELLATATRFLLGSLLECKFQKYRPSAVAISAVWCSLEEVTSLNQEIIPPILKQSIQKTSFLPLEISPTSSNKPNVDDAPLLLGFFNRSASVFQRSTPSPPSSTDRRRRFLLQSIGTVAAYFNPIEAIAYVFHRSVPSLAPLCLSVFYRGLLLKVFLRR